MLEGYRDWVRCDDLVRTLVSYKETDMCVMGEVDLKKEALGAIARYRRDIEDYIITDPPFEETLEPIVMKKGASPIVERMIEAARRSGVGPMAAVAGAVAEFVGRDLLEFSKDIIVENGGDVFIKSSKNRRFGIFAGNSALTGKLTFEIIAGDTPLGICTSSGTVGHSLSFGKADAACVISKDAALADAAATATGNAVKSADDIEKAIDFAKSIPGISGVIVVVGSKFGAWGQCQMGGV